MTLMSEIATLREEIDKKVRSRPETETRSEPSTTIDERDDARQRGVDALLAAASATVEELGQDVDKFPPVSTITAFAVGLAIGVALGRQVQ